MRALLVLGMGVLLAGCGGGDKQAATSGGAPAAPGKTVSGETESGMKLRVDTFVAPSSDPVLKQIDSWRVAAKYPAVDYHRVTADNSAGSVSDSGRVLRFSPNAVGLQAGRAVEARFSCDALAFEWVPVDSAKTAAWNALRKSVCADGPPKQDGIPAGSKKVYYLVTDRTFGSRGIRTMKVFGPRDVEFR